MLWRRLIASGFLCAVSLAAQAPPGTEGSANDRTDARFQQLQQALRERDAIIRNLLERVSELEKKTNISPAAGAESAHSVNVTLPNTALPNNTGAIPKPDEQGYNEEDRKARAALDRALIQRGGLLLPSGTLELETSASYFDASSDAISIEGFSILPVLVVGNIVSDRVRRQVALSNVTARLGLPWNFQMDVRAPYGYEQVRTVTADNKETSQHANGLGDVQVSLSRQIAKEHRAIPDLLANVSFKTKTGKDPFALGNNEIALGTGFYDIQGRITAVKSSDPMILFGSLSYAYNVPAGKMVPDPQNVGQQMLAHFEPGDTSGFQLGAALAVNPEASLTFSWDQSFTRGTTVNGLRIPGSNLVGGTLRFGGSYIYMPGRIIDLSLGIGLTRDVPNLQFTVGVPLRFNLWKPSRAK
ncbi:MAG TPA: transporter [Candidatus Binatia bacterium]|nr:transporter [Candidatus Binatia bacterium]